MDAVYEVSKFKVRCVQSKFKTARSCWHLKCFVIVRHDRRFTAKNEFVLVRIIASLKALIAMEEN